MDEPIKPTRKKPAPSPRYIAARLLLRLLAEPYRVTAEELAALVSSRVSIRKRMKVLGFVDRFINRLIERCQKVVDRRDSAGKM